MHTNYIFSALALALPVYSASSTANMGCYSEIESFKSQGPYTFQSVGNCEMQCAKNDFKVVALSAGNMCYCGNKVPSDSAKIADDKCDMLCAGWPEDNCGGRDTFSVFQAAENVKASGSENGTTVTEPTAATAAGGIIVAPSKVSSSTSIATAASKSANAFSKSASGAVATSSPTPTDNAAGTVRAGSSLLGAVVVGMGLLL
ncbi:hypothetical protein N7517_004662 [Penicillium concentricum]|uniref:WSC domain-containing protein n=1 Tax=Penicillium concentricum TaxID=293559 RepID=A0A9W9VAW4_9EURO|nr:uncharacterized protein N7517_004662 [Penicillium concentricum]KAJ5372656.1 hypothetical protein N7517_004662 [Penicillium concentricum]